MEFQVKEGKKLSNTYNLRFICSDNNCDVIGVEGVIFFVVALVLSKCRRDTIVLIN